MDLKRVALGLHRNSPNVASRFKQEALKRSKELEEQQTDPYVQKLLVNIKIAVENKEDALMYSILFQNFVLKKF